jgi:hypothetical protein
MDKKIAIEKIMDKKIAIEKIQEILARVISSDLLAFGQGVIADIEANRAERFYPESLLDRDPIEAEILAIAQKWAMVKIRRQVEDRLRKDNNFLGAVAKWPMAH